MIDIADVVSKEIRAALGPNPRPSVLMWLISAEMAARLQTDSIDFLTSDPSLEVEIHYPASGGLLVMIYYAKCGTDTLEEVISAVAEAGQIWVGELV